MTPQELKRIKRTFDILENGFIKRGKQLFESLLPEIYNHAEEVLKQGNTKDFAMPGQEKYLRLYKRYLQECYAQGMVTADLELEAKRKRTQFERIQNPSSIITSGSSVIPTEAINWLNNWTDYFGKDYYGDVTDKVVSTLQDSLKDGLTIKETKEKLSEVLVGSRYNEARLGNIARTNSTTAFNQGRLEIFRQAGDFVVCVQLISLLDDVTTDICRSRNGKIMRLDDPALAENTPPLHYQCRSILSPVSQDELEEMQAPGWQWIDTDAQGNPMRIKDILDWSKVSSPAKGFGELPKKLRMPVNINTEKNNQPGKLSKSKKQMGEMKISDQEINAVVKKFDELRNKYPDMIKEIDIATLRQIADYLTIPLFDKDIEPEAWEMISQGNIYSYACYIHEKIELESINQYQTRRGYHGKALFEQYTFLKDYIKYKTGQEYDIVNLCYNDAWIEGEKDITNSRYLSTYLKKYKPMLYNKDKHIEPKWKKGSLRITKIMNKFRETGDIE